jgi:hypothetical protein
MSNQQNAKWTCRKPFDEILSGSLALRPVGMRAALQVTSRIHSSTRHRQYSLIPWPSPLDPLVITHCACSSRLSIDRRDCDSFSCAAQPSREEHAPPYGTRQSPAAHSHAHAHAYKHAFTITITSPIPPSSPQCLRFFRTRTSRW